MPRFLSHASASLTMWAASTPLRFVLATVSTVCVRTWARSTISRFHRLTSRCFSPERRGRAVWPICFSPIQLLDSRASRLWVLRLRRLMFRSLPSSPDSPPVHSHWRNNAPLDFLETYPAYLL